MEVYQRALKDMLDVNAISNSLINPSHILEKYSHNRWVMRALRYFFYPRAINRLCSPSASVCHVVDHGYAHLVRGLPTESTSVITVHDLIPFLTWRGKIPSEKISRPSLNLYSMNHIRDFDQVVTPSQNTANDLCQYFEVEPSRVSVIPPVLQDYFCSSNNNADSSLRKRYGFADDSILLVLTGSDHYKNWQTSLHVVKALRSKGYDVKVLKTGLESREFDLLTRELKLEQHVRSFFVESHQQMPDLYHQADCLLFPSWYEGFGMPVAEALACGTPVVCSNSSSLREVGGQLALYSDPEDIDSLVEKMVSIIEDSEIKKRMSEQGPIWTAQFRAKSIYPKFETLYGLG